MSPQALAASQAAQNAALASTAAAAGASLVGVQDAAGSYAAANVEATLAELATMLYATRYSVEDARFGASQANTAAQNVAAIQACINAAPEGSVIYFPGRYQINDELVVNKSLTFMGPYGGAVYVRSAYAGLQQMTAAKACFKLVATTGMYAFGQYGIVGMRFVGLSAEGQPGSFAAAFVRCDTSINEGDFHVRENLFANLSLRWFTTGIHLEGIAYVNLFRENSVTQCGTCVKIERGLASDNGGQTRFYGGVYALSEVGLSLNVDASAGSFSLHGVTVSENSDKGIWVDEEVVLYMDGGCEIESNAVAGVYWEIAEANPNSSGVKTIQGKFLTNGADIYINKTTSAYAGGGFRCPVRIDNASLASAVALRIDVPDGHIGIDDPNFVIGRNVSGNSNGSLVGSQISQNFLGTWERRAPFSKRYVVPSSYVSGAVIDSLPAGLVVESFRAYMTANCTSFSSLQFGDQGDGTRYFSIGNGQTQSLNTWVTWTPPVPQFITDAGSNQIRIVGTGGWLSAAAVVEIKGYTVE